MSGCSTTREQVLTRVKGKNHLLQSASYTSFLSASTHCPVSKDYFIIQGYFTMMRDSCSGSQGSSDWLLQSTSAIAHYATMYDLDF